VHVPEIPDIVSRRRSGGDRQILAPKVRTTEIARAMGIDEAQVCSVIDKLERDGT
jgi:DNA-binding MarR family transcriptional regulator